MFGFGGRQRRISFNIVICVEKDGEKYYAHCPSLKRLHVDGETQEAALENVKLATVLYIKSLIKHGDPIPLQLILKNELKNLCEIDHQGRSVMPGYPHSELVQVPV